MHDIEQRLKEARLVAPSIEVDRRIQALFASARLASERPRIAPFSGWLALAASAGLAALFVISAALTAPSPVLQIFEVQAEGPLRELLVAPPSAPVPDFEFIVTSDALLIPDQL